MPDISDPQFFEPYTITWPPDNPAIQVREFIDDDGEPVREIVQADGTRTRHPVDADIHLT